MKTLPILCLLALVSFGFKPHAPLHNVYFPHDSGQLSGVNAQLVKEVFAKLPDTRTVRFGVMGGFSTTLTMQQRNELSMARAHSIVNLLEANGAETDQIQVTDRYEKYGWPKGSEDAVHEMALQVEVTKGRPWVAPVLTSIDDYLPLPVQKFTIDPRKDQVITGQQGTEITIPANTLHCKDGSRTATMNMELTEVYGRNQLVNADLHTASNGRMLESGGTVLLEAFCGSSPAAVSPGKDISLSFPNEGEAKEGMETFIGETDRYGNFNWQQDRSGSYGGITYRDSYYINDKKVSKEEYLAMKAQFEEAEQVERNEVAVAANDEAFDAYLLKSGSLGWINCDRFYDAEATTEFVVNVDTALHPSVRLVFDNINSVMNGTYDPRKGKVVFSGIPVGEKARVVGYSIVNDVPYMASQSITIAPNQTETLRLQQTSKQGMEQQLASLR
jgi:hypothetical protein